VKTLIGLIPDREHALSADQALHGAGIGASRISALARPAEVWERLEGRKKLNIVSRDGRIGALLGLAVSAIYLVPLVIMYCPEMGCSSATRFIFLTVMALCWALGGAFLGTIVGTDQLEHDLYSYVEGVRHGGVVLLVESPDEQAAAVSRILRQENGLLVHTIERG
jgi:hypothetical protein